MFFGATSMKSLCFVDVSRASEKSPSRVSRSSSSNVSPRSISPTRRQADRDTHEPSVSRGGNVDYPSTRSPSSSRTSLRGVHRMTSSDAPPQYSKEISGKRKFKMKRPRFFQKDNNDNNDKAEKERHSDRDSKRRGSFSMSRTRRSSVSMSRSRSLASPQQPLCSPAERTIEEESMSRTDKESFFRCDSLVVVFQSTFVSTPMSKRCFFSLFSRNVT